MGNEDEGQVGALIVGGVLGALLATPKPEERQWLDYRKECSDRSKIINHLIPSSSVPEIVKSYIHESRQLFCLGYFRSSSIVSAISVEVALKEKYKTNLIPLQAENKSERTEPKGFYQLLEWAQQQNLLSKDTFGMVDGLRILRNEEYIHPKDGKVSLDDAQLMHSIAIRAANQIFEMK